MLTRIYLPLLLEVYLTLIAMVSGANFGPGGNFVQLTRRPTTTTLMPATLAIRPATPKPVRSKAARKAGSWPKVPSQTTTTTITTTEMATIATSRALGFIHDFTDANGFSISLWDESQDEIDAMKEAKREARRSTSTTTSSIIRSSTTVTTTASSSQEQVYAESIEPLEYILAFESGHMSTRSLSPLLVPQPNIIIASILLVYCNLIVAVFGYEMLL